VKTAKSVNRVIVGWFRLFSPLTHSIADGTGIPKNKFYNLTRKKQLEVVEDLEFWGFPVVFACLVFSNFFEFLLRVS
jgi:hypothetical protein